MDLSSFGEYVATLSRTNDGARPLVRGMTTTGILLACFDHGERGVTTTIANNRAGNDSVTTFDERPWRTENPDYQQIKIAAIATKHLWVVDEGLKAHHQTRRDRCGTTLSVGLEKATLHDLNAWYLELTTQLYPDGSRSTFLGDLAVHPFQNFAG